MLNFKIWRFRQKQKKTRNQNKKMTHADQLEKVGVTTVARLPLVPA